jgi:hypothetical protein
MFGSSYDATAVWSAVDACVAMRSAVDHCVTGTGSGVTCVQVVQRVGKQESKPQVSFALSTFLYCK